MLRKFSRLICFSIAVMMTVEAPAQATPPTSKQIVQEAFHHRFKILEMKTYGDVLDAGKADMPPATYAKFEKMFAPHKKDKLPKMTVVENKLVITGPKKSLTVEFRDPAGKFVLINGEKFSVAELLEVDSAMKKIELSGGAKSASIHHLMLGLFVEKAEALDDWLLYGGLGLFGGGLLLSVMWDPISRWFSGDSKSKRKTAKERREEREQERRERLEKAKNGGRTPPAPTAAVGRPADDNNRCEAYPRPRTSDPTKENSVCEISNVVEYYGLTIKEAHDLLCGQNADILSRPGDSRDSESVDEAGVRFADKFHADKSARLREYYERQGFDKEVTEHSVDPSTGKPVPIGRKVSPLIQRANARLCFKIAARNQKNKCNPMQKPAIILRDPAGDQRLDFCDGKTPMVGKDNKSGEGGWGRLLQPYQSPCETYEAANSVSLETACSGGTTTTPRDPSPAPESDGHGSHGVGERNPGE